MRCGTTGRKKARRSRTARINIYCTNLKCAYVFFPTNAWIASVLKFWWPKGIPRSPSRSWPHHSGWSCTLYTKRTLRSLRGRDPNGVSLGSVNNLLMRDDESSCQLEQRSYFEIPYRDLLWRYHITLCTDSPAQGSCTAASTENLSMRSFARFLQWSSQRELAESEWTPCFHY